MSTEKMFILWLGMLFGFLFSIAGVCLSKELHAAENSINIPHTGLESIPEYGTGKPRMLGAPDARGRIQGDALWPVGWGYTIDNHELWVSNHVSRSNPPELRQPILFNHSSIKGVTRFYIHSEQRKLFVIRDISQESDECYPVGSINSLSTRDGFRVVESQLKAAGLLAADAIYTHYVDRLDNCERGREVFYTGLAESFGGILIDALHTPLPAIEHIKVYIPEPRSESVQPAEAPDWVKRRLRNNPQWIAAAAKRLQGMRWEQYYDTRGYIPGDRSILDMIYNFDLRMATPVRRIIDPCESGFGPRCSDHPRAYTRCAADLYWDEMQQRRIDRKTANDKVNQYLGVSDEE